MTPREIWERLTTWAHRDRLQAEVDAERDAHAELLARDLERDGLTREEARATALRQLGHRSTQRQDTRDAWGFPAIDIVLQDLRYALRGLRRSPVFTATAVVTLGLGIGANAAMFAVVDRLMFRPLPHLAEPSEVGRVYLQTSREGRRVSNHTVPYTRYLDIKSGTRSFSDYAAISEWRLSVGVGQETRVRKVAGVSGSLFGFFSARPVAGRFFGPADDVIPVGAAVAVLSHAYWRSELGSADVIGRRLRIGMLDYTIIGVAPAGFVGAASGRAPDLFVPITTIPATMAPWGRDTYFQDYRWDWTDILVRRKPGVSAEVANADLGEAYRRSRAKQRESNPRVLPDSIARPAAIAGPVRTAAGPDAGMESRVLLWVAGVAAIVLLIACANVTNLMLARILRRRREIALRLALGVSRPRLAAQFATEALTLALLGAVTGLFVAQWAGAGIRALLLPEGSAFNLASDPRTIAVAIGASVLGGLLTVIVPIVLALRSDLATALKAGARDGGYRSTRLRTSLLVVQSALSVSLLVGAGLFVRSLQNVMAIPLGYDVSTVLEVFTDFRGDEPGDSAARVAMRRRLLATAAAIPGAEAAARVNSVVFATNTANLRVPGIDSVERLGRFNFQLTTPGYFTVMRTRILRGRGFDQRDGEGSAPSVIVSASMARALWPGRDALGQCIQVTFGDEVRRETAPCVTVIGIAEDAAQRGITDEQRFMYYLPVDQVNPAWSSSIYVRMAPGDIDASIERVRREMQAAMPGNGFVVVSPEQKRVDDQRRSWRLGATLFLAFGALALIVAAIGLYGVTGYNVAQRMHELGVRIALGAGTRNIVGLVIRDSLAVTAAGVAIGLGVALFASRWIEPLLYKHSARDPATYGAIAAIMIAVSLLASAAPAMRATRADPNRALRSE